MDFEFATSRLKKDHDALRSRAKRRPQTLASSKATLEARKKQEYRQKQLERKKELQRLEKQKSDYIRFGFDDVERRLGVVRNLGPVSVDTGTSVGVSDGLELEATSVHGQGDKITLPTSLLATLASRDLLQTSQEKGQPLFFRLGIRRPWYSFPSSDKMKQMMEDYNIPEKRINIDDEEDDDENKDAEWEQAYIDELSHEYISCVYATVVEFTQEEGFIGLPKCISDALLLQNQQQQKQSDDYHHEENEKRIKLKSKFTVDPAALSSVSPMDIDNDISNENENDDSLETKTPGHTAYGAFPIPMDKIQITLLTNLPLGTKCTLQPTQSAIQNGFYNLKDVKIVLEQSLIRTRGCLNMGDVVHCWHRGKKFDLFVKDLYPNRIGAVSCVNTDVEVDIAGVDDDNDDDSNKNSNGGDYDSSMGSQSTSGMEEIGKGRILSGGYRLQSNDEREKTKPSLSTTTLTSINTNMPESMENVSAMIQALKLKEISPEPPKEQKENIITVQIRGGAGSAGAGGKQCRRRFNTLTSKMDDVFSYVLSEGLVHVDFRLVTRFPRRVFHLNEDGGTLLKDLSLSSQELFLVEKM